MSKDQRKDAEGGEKMETPRRRARTAKAALTAQLSPSVTITRVPANNSSFQRKKRSPRLSATQIASSQRHSCDGCQASFRHRENLEKHKAQCPGRFVDLAIPVVDLSHQDARQKLQRLGVKFAARLPTLSNKYDQASFAIPMVSLDQANNPNLVSLEELGASNLLYLGQLEPL